MPFVRQKNCRSRGRYAGTSASACISTPTMQNTPKASSAPYPTDESRLFFRAVQSRLKQLYREGFSYAKAQVKLLDLYKMDDSP
ncbi:hypothetical protein CF149_07309 [Pseudomonas psychrophila]|nr:hypothetical protein CF149_07309 [Pseudomonas psychrophila]